MKINIDTNILEYFLTKDVDINSKCNGNYIIQITQYYTFCIF